MADYDQVSLFYLMDGNRLCSHRGGINPNAAVHFRRLDFKPLVVESHEGVQVRGGIESLRENTVLRRWLHLNRFLLVERQGTVLFDLGQDGFEDLGGWGLDEDPRRAPVGAALADLDVEDFKLGTEVDDQVEDLGEDKRIDDVTGELDHATRHDSHLRS